MFRFKIFVVCVCLLLLAGCGVFPLTSRNTIDLTITSFTATDSLFSATIKNTRWGKSNDSYIVQFSMDAVYVENPQTTSITVDGVGSEEVITVEANNNLSSSDGVGGHCVTILVDSGSNILEADETNNTAYAYYYDGAYAADYASVFAAYPGWITTIKSRVNSFYDFPTTESYNFHIVDNIPSGSGTLYGQRDARTINGTDTSVILFNLSAYNNGYATFIYDGQTYPLTTSDEVTYHEYTHAYHRDYVIDNSDLDHWLATDSWFREGIALFTSDEGAYRVRYLIKRRKDLGDTLAETKTALLDGLDDANHGFWDYAEDYLAILYIVQTYGGTVLKDIVQAQAGGISADTAVIGNLPVATSWAEFKDEVDTYARSYIDAVYPKIN